MKINIYKNSNYFWRIIFTIMIVSIHSPIVINDMSSNGWYLAVDYFFIISAFFLFDDYKKKKSSVSAYTVNRIKRLYPHQLFSYAIILLFIILTNKNFSLRLLVNHTSEALPFTYFWQDYNFTGEYQYNFQVWYLSVLLLMGIFIYYMLEKHEYLFCSVIAPMSIILIYGYIYKNCKSFNTGNMVGNFLNEYYLRGYADMCVGIVVYQLVKYLTKYSFKVCFFIITKIIELLCFTIFAVGTYYWGNSKNDVWWILILIIGITSSFIQSNTNILSLELFKKISNLTYAMYLNHIFINMILNEFGIKNYSIFNMLMYLLILLMYSVITNYVVIKITDKINDLKYKLIV